MALLTNAQAVATGYTLTYQSLNAGGDEFVNNGRAILLARSVAAGDVTITLTPANPPAGTTFATYTYTIPGGSSGNVRHVLGPFPPRWWNDANGRVSFTCSSAADVTVRVLNY